jgi:2-keto-4-pentenoate hydratase
MTDGVNRPVAMEEIAQQLLQARKLDKGIHTSDIIEPSDFKSAMQIQSLVQYGMPIDGWKVAIGPEKKPIAAPLVEILKSTADMRLFPNCFIEVEVAISLNKNLPIRDALYTRSEILEAIDYAFLGIEVIGGRYEDPKGVPFLAFLADHLGNRAFITGDQLPITTVDLLAGLSCSVSFEGSTIFSGTASHPAQDPLAPLLAYANHQNDYVGGLKAGQIVTTGSLCGVLPINSAGIVKANLGTLGQVAIRFNEPAELFGFLVR